MEVIPNAFIFSINNEKYYKVNKNPEKSIYSDQNRGPNFDGLWVREPFFKKVHFGKQLVIINAFLKFYL